MENSDRTEIEFLKDLVSLKNNNEKIREILENSIFIYEERTRNGTNVDNISIIVPKDKYLSCIVDSQNEVERWTNDKYKYTAYFYRIGDIDKAIENINTYSDDLQELEDKIFGENFYQNCIKAIDLEDIKKQKILEETLEIVNEGIKSLGEIDKVARFNIIKTDDDLKGSFISMKNNKIGEIEFELETSNISELFDKTFKYLALNNFEFHEPRLTNDKFEIYDTYREKIDVFLEENELAEFILNDGNILLDNIKNIEINKDVESISFQLSSIPYEKFEKSKIEIKDNGKTLTKKLDIKRNYGGIGFESVSAILTDKDIGREYFKDNIAHTKENKQNLDLVLDAMVSNLSEISNKDNKLYSLDIKKQEFKLPEYNLAIKDLNGKIETEIKSENISDFVKDVFQYIEEKGKKLENNINVDDLKIERKNGEFSISIYNMKDGNDRDNFINIIIPTKNNWEIYKKELNTTNQYSYIGMKDLIKELLTDQYSSYEVPLKNRNDVYIKTDNLEKEAKNMVKKLNKALEGQTWKDFENDVLARAYNADNIFSGIGMEADYKDIYDRITDKIDDLFSEKTLEEKIKLLENNTKELGLNLNENGLIQEFLDNQYGDQSRNEYKDFGWTIELNYKENALNFYHQKHCSLFEEVHKKLIEIFNGEKIGYQENEETQKKIHYLIRENGDKEVGIISLESEFLEKIFITDIKNQPDYLKNYVNTYDEKDSRSKEYFDKNFNLERFNSKLEKIGYHKISEEKAKRIARSIELEMYDVILEKNKFTDKTNIINEKIIEKEKELKI